MQKKNFGSFGFLKIKKKKIQLVRIRFLVEACIYLNKSKKRENRFGSEINANWIKSNSQNKLLIAVICFKNVF